MNFLSPAFLVALPLVAVPVVIHLLSRRQQKKISWGAMRFLLQAATRRRRLWRLTDILLLLLRTAALVLFIAALARPLLPTTWLGGGLPREVILILDQSMSMARKADGSSVFELQLQRASEFLDELQASDTIRVLLAGESPEWLTADSVPATASVVRKLRARIDNLKPTLGASDLLACVGEAVDLEAPKDKSARVIAVVTDRQRFAWRMDDRPLWAAIQTRIQQSAIPTFVNLQFVGPEKPAANLCVNRIATTRAFGAPDQIFTFSASVQNYSETASTTTLLTWHVNDQSIGVTTAPELAPGASTTLTINHQFTSPGTFEVRCHLEAADDLAPDNEAHLLIDIHERLPVLVVEETKSDDPADSDTPFILAALGARKSAGSDRPWRSVFEPTVVETGSIESTELGRFRCVVLADTGKLSAGMVDKLEDYVEAGGGVWLALGDGVEPQSFNDRVYRGGGGLAPMKIAATVGDPNDREKFFSLRASSDAHPATMLLSDFQRLDLDRARVYRRHQFDPLSGKDVSILLQAEGGEPVVVERKLGRGRVLVQGMPLGVSWSTLPLCQAYVAMVHEWLWYLAEPSLPKHNLAVGEALIAAAPDSNATAELTLPDDRKVDLEASLASGTPQFRYTATRLPGKYALQVKAGRGTEQRMDSSAAAYYVERNARESDLKSIDERDQQQLAAVKEFQLDKGLDAITASSKLHVPKHPLEGMLLAVLAFVFLAEIGLAGWTTHRRNLRVRPVTMEA